MTTNGYGGSGITQLSAVEDMARHEIVGNPSFAKEARESFLSPGSDLGDVMLRGSWQSHQIDAGARMIATQIHFAHMAGRKIPDSWRFIAELPDHGVRVLSVSVFAQAALEGSARQEALQAHTGGMMMNMAGRGRRGMRGFLGRLTGRGSERSSLEVE